MILTVDPQTEKEELGMEEKNKEEDEGGGTQCIHLNEWPRSKQEKYYSRNTVLQFPIIRDRFWLQSFEHSEA